MESNYTLSDIAAVTDGGMGGMGGNWFAWILLFALFGGGGFGGWANRGEAATFEQVAGGFNFSGVNNKLNEITAAIAGTNQNISNSICQLGYQALEQSSMLGSKIDSCCCATQRAVDSVKFDLANYNAATNAAISENTQKVLDAITGNRMADMQNQINQLQLQSALCGIPRTNPYGYGIYAYPTCTSACGACTNI